AGADPLKEAPPKAPVNKADPFDAGDYLPITREEIKEEAKGKNLFSSFAFGLRSVIPPADDLRTRLIDRAMVTHGLLSPEQLQEIHSVGTRMDELKPTMAAVEHKAVKAGEAAVEA